MFVITKIWLESNKTKNGGYSRKQLEVLNQEWPPVKKWTKQVCGMRISEVRKLEFEELKHSQCSSSLIHAKKVISKLSTLELKEIDQYIKRLLK